MKYLRRTKIINVFNKYWGNSQKNYPIPFAYIIAGGLVFNTAIRYHSLGKVYTAQLNLVSALV